MAIGDYSKTTYVKGQAPAINEINLNKNENKTAELDQTLSTHLTDYENLKQSIEAGELLSVEFTGPVASLPDTCKDGLVSDTHFKGNTQFNGASFGACEDTVGWVNGSATISTDNTNKFEGANCLKVVTTADGEQQSYRNILPLLDKTKYYLLSMYMKNGNASNGVRLMLDCAGDLGVIQTPYVTVTSYQRVGLIIKPSDFDNATNVYFKLRVNGTTGQYGYFDAISILEISASEYAEGATALLAKKPYTKPNVAVSTLSGRITTKDEEENIVSQAYYPEVGRSLLNGVYDEVYEENGQWWHDQNINDKVLQASDIELMATWATNVDMALTKVFTDNKTWSDQTKGMANVNGKTEIISSELNNIDSIGKFYTTSSQRIAFIVEKGTTLAQAQAALTGLTLIYQLATPIITKIWGRSLKVGPNYTVFVEPNVVYDVGYYNAGKITVEANRPIKSMDFVSKINIDTGEFTPVDSTKITLAPDGLSFTIADAADGEYYEYAGFGDPADSTYPTVSFAYAANIAAQVSNNANAIQAVNSNIENVNLRIQTVNDKIDTHTDDNSAHNEIVSMYRSNKDTNDVFTMLEWKRPDGTLWKKSVLSGGTSPKYTTRTVTYYQSDGATVKETKVYTLTYTGDDLTSEVLS